MTYNHQCKTCNLPDPLLTLSYDMYESGNGFLSISKELSNNHSIYISSDALRNHFKKHYDFYQVQDSDDEPVVENVSNPSEFRPSGIEINEDGKGFLQTPAISGDEMITDFSDILREMNVDPNEFVVMGTARISKWKNREDGDYLTSYRVNIQKKETLEKAVEDILPTIQTYEPKVPDSKETQDHAFVFVAGDLQLGKVDGDGTEGIVKRYRESLQKAVDKLNSLDHMASEVLISWVGDCIEGMVSQGGRNARRTELTTTQQVKLLRKLMTETILAFSSLSPR